MEPLAHTVMSFNSSINKFRRMLRPYVGKLADTVNVSFIVQNEVECAIFGDLYAGMVIKSTNELFSQLRIPSDVKDAMLSELRAMIASEMSCVFKTYENKYTCMWLSETECLFTRYT